MKNIKKTIKITKNDKKISDLVSVFMNNNKKFAKLEAKRLALVEKLTLECDKIDDEIDHVINLVQDAQEKLENLGLDSNLMNCANGYKGYEEMIAAIKKMNKLILK